MIIDLCFNNETEEVNIWSSFLNGTAKKKHKSHSVNKEKTKKTLELYTDGACSGNPGQAAVGVVIKQRGRTIRNISQVIGIGTNNVAEYTALIYGLQEALMLHADNVKVHTDSELLYNQVIGNYKIKNPNLRFLHTLVQHLTKGFKHIEIKLVPRERNREADKLATKAIKKEQAKMAAPLFDIGEESPSSAG